MNLAEFLVQAKTTGCAAGGPANALKLADGGLQLDHQQGDTVYSDIFYGLNPFNKGWHACCY